MAEDIYRRLAEHMSTLGMGLPATEGLEGILKANFTTEEAEVALALPTRVAPMQPVSVAEINTRINLPREKWELILEGLVKKDMLFSGKTKTGEKGYALLQLAHGFPQTFFWQGKDTPHGRNMAQLIARYLNRSVMPQAYGGAQTKSFRYIPVGETIDMGTQAVYPYDVIENVIRNARVIALAHCPCRMMAQMRGKGCNHPLEVCLKYDELAEYTIERGLARKISQDEALAIIKKSEEMGLVHFADNAMGGIKHT
jgi:hypothetical protein